MRAIVLALLMAVATPAFALDDAVRRACTGDYFEFCSHTFPGSAACSACFRKVGAALSSECLAAIRDSNEFGGEYQTRRRQIVGR